MIDVDGRDVFAVGHRQREQGEGVRPSGDRAGHLVHGREMTAGETVDNDGGLTPGHVTPRRGTGQPSSWPRR